MRLILPLRLRAGKKLSHRAAAAQKLELWSPFKERPVVGGRVGPDGSVAKSPENVLSMLSCEWAPVFSHKPTNEIEAEEDCRRWPTT